MNWNILPGCPLTPCFQEPDIAGISVWKREDERESSGMLCGTEGTIRQTVYTSGNVRLVQEHFHVPDDAFDAFRSILENRTEGVLTIRSLTPFAAACNPDGREYFCEKRLKPEKPYSAIHHGEEIEADNVLVFRSCTILLLIGWLDQHRHLGTLRLSRNPAGAVSYEKQYLLHASCDCLSQELPPGETLVSQWCGLTSGTEFHALLDELNSRYECSGFWIDMIGWFDHICYCPACRERFRRETGFPDLPTTIDWNSPEWLRFQHCREQWLAEFAAKIRATVRARTPERSVALQCSGLLTGWGGALSPEFLRESDYLAADLYSDQYEQSFVCKLFRAFSPHQPIEFMVPRCENLAHHTTSRSEADLEMRSYASLANQASFTLIDAIDPAGTLDPRFYQTAGRINRNLKRFRNGLSASSVPVADAGIYYDIASAADVHQSPLAVKDFRHDLSAYRRMIHLLLALQERHLLAAFTGRHEQDTLSRFRVIIVSEAARLSREDCEILTGYVRGGGRLYVSGSSSLFDPLEGLRDDFLLAPLLGIRFTGQWFPKGYYQKPVPSGGEQETPPVVSDFPQPRIAVAAPDAKVLATVAAPYSDAEEPVRFGSAISNPPEYDTGIPSLIRRRVGAGCVVYSSAVIEREGYDFHRACFADRIEALLEGKRILSSNAPGAVEFTLFRQTEKQCWILSLLHFTTELPPPPLYGISVTLRMPESLRVTRICPAEEPAACEISFRRNGELLEFELEKLEKFAMLRIEMEARR